MNPLLRQARILAELAKSAPATDIAPIIKILQAKADSLVHPQDVWTLATVMEGSNGRFNEAHRAVIEELATKIAADLERAGAR